MTLLHAFGAAKWLGHRGCYMSSSVLNQALLSSKHQQLFSPLKRSLFMKPGGKRKIMARHKWDGVPKDYNLIYQSNLKDYVGGFKVTLGAIAVACLGLYAFDSRTKTLTEGERKTIVYASLFLFAIVIVPCIWVRHIFKRIYFHPATGRFMAVRRTFFGRSKNIKYSAENVQILSKPGEESHHGIMVKVKGQKMSIGAADFVSPQYYNMHFGLGGTEPGFKDLSQIPKF